MMTMVMMPIGSETRRSVVRRPASRRPSRSYPRSSRSIVGNGKASRLPSSSGTARWYAHDAPCGAICCACIRLLTAHARLLRRQEEYLADPWHFRAPEGESEKEVEERMHAFFDTTVMPLYRRFCEEEEERRAKEEETGIKDERLKQRRELKVAIVSHGCALRYVHLTCSSVTTRSFFGRRGRTGEDENKKSEWWRLQQSTLSGVYLLSCRCFLRRVLNTDSRGFRFELSNTATCELILVGSRWTVRTLNSTSHLH